MAVRTKTKRRLLILLLCVAGVIGAGAGFYAFRMAQIRQDVLASRDAGIESYRESDYESALHQLGRYVQRNPDDADTLYLYAQSRLNVPEPRSRHLVEGAQLLARVTEIDPGHATAAQELLALYRRIGFSNETIDLADRLLARQPQNPEALRAKIDALLTLRRFDEVESIAAELLGEMPPAEVEPGDAARLEAVRGRALSLAQQDRNREALPLIDRYTELNPGDFRLQLLAVEMRQELRIDPAQTVQRVSELAERYPDEPRFRVLLGVAHRLAGDETAAREAVLGATEAIVTDPLAVRVLVSELDGWGLYRESVDVLDAAVAHAQDLPPEQRESLRRQLVVRLVTSGMIDQAADTLSGIDPASGLSDAGLLGMRGMIAALRDDDALARQAYDALASRAEDPVAQGWAGYLRVVHLDPAPVNEVVETLRASLAQQEADPFFLDALASAYRQVGEFDQAIESWRQAQAAVPSWSGPLVRVIEALLASNRPELAFGVARQAMAQYPRDVRVAQALALAVGANVENLSDEQLDGLGELLDQIATALPQDDQTLPTRLLLLLRRGEAEQAQWLVESVLGRDRPASDTTILRLIRVANAESAPEAVIEPLQRFYEERYGQTPAAVLTEAFNLLRTGRQDAALEMVRQRLEQAPPAERGEWAFAWARVLTLAEDGRALGAWAEAFELTSDNALALRQMLDVDAVWQDPDLVARAIDRLRALTGESAVAWRVAEARRLLSFARGSADVAEARNLLEKVIAEAPANVQARVLYARASQRLGNPAQAVNALSRAIELRPDQVELRLNLADVFQAQGEDARARQVIEELRRSGDDFSPSQQRALARVLIGLGESDEAIVALETANAQSPQAESKLLLAQLYRRVGKPDLAGSLYESLLDGEPSAAVIEAASAFFADRGETRRARSLLDRLDGMDLEPGVAELIRANAMRREGDAEAALSAYRRAVEAAPDSALAWRNLVAFLIGLRRDAEAMEQVRAAAAAGVSDPAIDLIAREAGRLEAASGDTAVNNLLVAMILSPDQRDALADALTVYLDAVENETPAAQPASAVSRLASENPGNAPLQVFAITLLRRAQLGEEAANLASRAAQIAPDSSAVLRSAYQALADQGRWREAISVARTWRRVSGQQRDADLAIAAGLLQVDEPSAALRQLTPYLEADGADQDPRLTELRAAALAASGSPQQAWDLLEPKLSESAGWRRLWIDLAGRVVADEQSVRWLERVESQTPPDDAGNLVALAIAWQRVASRLAQPELAQRGRNLLAERADQPDPPASVLEALAVLSEMAGDVAGAEAGYQRTLSVDPTNAVSLNNLAMILVNRGEGSSEAVELAQRAVDAAPGVPSFRDTLALALAANGRTDEAIQQLEQAQAMDPGNAEWSISTAAVLLDADRIDEAQQVLASLRSRRSSLSPPLLQRYETLLRRAGMDEAGSEAQSAVPTP